VFQRGDVAIADSDAAAAKVHLGYLEVLEAAASSESARVVARVHRTFLAGRLALLEGRGEDAVELLAPLRDGPPPELEMDWSSVLDALGQAYLATDRPDAAIEAWTAAREGLPAGASSQRIAPLLANLGAANVRANRYARGIELYEEALALVHDIPAWASAIRGNLAVVRRLSGDTEGAQQLQVQALEQATAIYGGDHPAVCNHLDELGILARLRGDHDEALDRLERARTIRTKHFGPDQPPVAETLTQIGKVWLAAGEPEKAAESLTKALAIRTEHRAAPIDLAETKLALAHALAKSAPARARDLAAEARTDFAGHEREAPWLAAELAGWHDAR
jgi:eukaryotic-like serine/threonine-protein kinase